MWWIVASMIITHNKAFEWTCYQKFDVVFDFHLTSNTLMVITHNKTFEWTCYKNLMSFIIALPQANNALICGPYLSQIFEGEDFMKERIFTFSYNWNESHTYE
jgi:hypothetical protein